MSYCAMSNVHVHLALGAAIHHSSQISLPVLISEALLNSMFLPILLSRFIKVTLESQPISLKAVRKHFSMGKNKDEFVVHILKAINVQTGYLLGNVKVNSTIVCS